MKNKDGQRKILLIALVALGLSFGCQRQDAATQAEGLALKSDAYYLLAVDRYKKLISQGEDANALGFKLGKLYFEHGDFAGAAREFNKLSTQAAAKYLAISYYKMGNLTDALEAFSKNDIPDDEYLYYHGLVCEKLNLFDLALENYRKIKSGAYLDLARGRKDAIEKLSLGLNIRTLSPSTYSIMQQAPPPEKYPQAGALILWCDERIEVTPQNTEISTLHYIVKILNERGKQGFSETSIDYDSTYEKVSLEYARTIKPDGTVAEVGARHIRDVSKYLNFPLYSNARVFIISFPEISEGAVIEYEAKVYRNRLVNKKDFMIGYPLQAQEPIIRADFSVSLPQGKGARLKNINEAYNSAAIPLSPQVLEAQGKTVYSWKFQEIPQIIPEASMPPMAEVNPTILISTFQGWGEIYQWWWELAKDKISADQAIREKVKELTAKLVTPEEKARAVYDFCARKIRYVAVEYGQAGYEPHQAADIFRNKYGDCKDQSILLVTMLKAAGLSAWPVLIPTRDCYNLQQDFPSMLFDHCIAALELQGKIIFMDPTAETCPFKDLPPADQSRRVLVIKEEGYTIADTPLFPSSHNVVEHDLNITIKDDESIEAEKSVESRGVYNQGQRNWLIYTPPELIRQALSEKIQDVSIGAKLKDYRISGLEELGDFLTLAYVFSGPEYVTAAGSLRLMPQLAGMDTSLVAKDSRTYPVDFGILDMKDTQVKIEIPASWKVKYLPAAVEEDSPWMKCSLSYAQNGRAINFRQRMEMKKTEVTLEEYPEFKKFFETLAKKIKQRVVLEIAK